MVETRRVITVMLPFCSILGNGSAACNRYTRDSVYCPGKDQKKGGKGRLKVSVGRICASGDNGDDGSIFAPGMICTLNNTH